jgi:histidinol-phosphatase (PHP family)
MAPERVLVALMFLADYHTHSAFSFDAEKDGFPELIASARKAGLDELCITDHCDISSPKPFPAEERQALFEKAQSNGGVKALLGIELGDPLYNLNRAEAEAGACPYDFILGSLHMLRGEKDFYFIEYGSLEHCHRLLAQYFEELREMAEWGGFDVLGHIDYPLRLMRKAGYHVGLLPGYEEEVRDLFTLCAAKGLGIEVNFKTEPLMDGLLPLFKQMGGEIVTLGSDAHSAAGVGKGIADGIGMCRAAGFGYIAAYEKRKVRYEKI